jgi:hypothetical protein
MKALLIVLLLPACGYLGNPDGFRAVNLTHGQETQVKSAMTAWNIATGDTRHMELDDEGGSSIEIVDDAHPENPAADGSEWHSYAPIGGGRSRILIERTVTGDRFREIILHELGHHLGCRHEADGTVMDKDNQETTELTEADIACAGDLEPI